MLETRKALSILAVGAAIAWIVLGFDGEFAWLSGLIAVAAVAASCCIFFSSTSTGLGKPWHGLVLAAAVAAGLVVSAQVSAAAVSRTAAVIVAAASMSVALFVIVAGDPHLWIRRTARHVDAILAVCIVLRAATCVFGSYAFATGRLFGMVQIGEFTRIAVVGAVCAAMPVLWASRTRLRGQLRSPTSWVSAGPARTVVLFLGYLLVLAFARDLGPAVLCTTAVVLSVPAISKLRLRQWVLLAGAGVLLGAAVVSVKGADRFALLFDPSSDAQVRAAWDAVRFGGIFGSFSSPILEAIPAVASDFMPAAIMAVFGTVPAAVLIGGVVGVVCGVVADTGSVDEERRPVVTGLAVLLCGLLAWTVGANAAVLPLSGLSAPFLVPSPSSIASSLIMLALVKAFAVSVHTPGGDGRPTAFLAVIARGRRFAAVSIAVLVATMVYAVPAGPAATTAERMGRADILTSDGQILAGYDEAGARVYEGRPGMYQQIAFVAGSGTEGWRSWRGIEYNQVLDLTCGERAEIVDELMEFFHPMQCRGVDVLSTVDSRVQEEAAAALGDALGQVAVLDSDTGAILALFDSADSGQSHIGDDYEELTRSRPNSADRPYYPASTMKIVTAAVGILDSVSTRGISLTEYSLPDGGIENADGFVCPDASIETMLARSCNTTAAAVAVAAGDDRFSDVATEYFGFDQPLVDGMDGVIDAGAYSTPTLGWSENGLDDGDLARSAIGMQSVRTNILNLAAIGAVVASPDVAAPAPRLVAGTCDGGEFHRSVENQGTINRTPLPTVVASRISAGMAGAVNGGTATALAELGSRVIAKTGTADVETVEGSVEDTTLISILDGRYVVATRVHESTETVNSLTVGAAVLEVLSQHVPAAVRCPGAADEDR